MHIDTRIQTARAPGEQRRWPRLPVSATAVLRALGSHGRGATIRDLSVTGFMAESDQSFVAGEGARLQLPELGFVSARVVWSGQGRIGGEFDQPLQPGAFTRIVTLCGR